MTWKPLRASALAAATFGAGLSAAWAQEPFISEIKITANTYCPVGWAEMNGQTMPIKGNDRLYSLLNCNYADNCQTSFSLPDLRGRTPIGRGVYASGTDWSRPYSIGQRGGADTTVMTVAMMPEHRHQLYASSDTPTSTSPAGNDIATFPTASPVDFYSTAAPGAKTMSAHAIGSTGAAAPFAIRQPGLGLRFCIAIDGLYPPRN